MADYNDTKNVSISCQETEAQELEEAWQHFRVRRDSLRIAVSNIAALTGYHPYKNVPELVLNLVYQGQDGRALLRHDAKLLGIAIRSQECLLAELAHAAGPATAQAFYQATTLQNNNNNNVQKAQAQTAAVVQAAQASGKLNEVQLKQLSEGVRSTVDTGFGLLHENEALDWFQQFTQCEVRCRNQEVVSWAFVKCHNHKNDSTVVPMGPPTFNANNYRRQEQHANNEKKRLIVLEDDNSADEDYNVPPVSPNNNNKNNKKLCNNGVSNSRCSQKTTATTRQLQNAIDLASSDNEEDKKKHNEDRTTETATTTKRTKQKSSIRRPFFYIVGSVDGIRDQLVVTTTDKNEEEEEEDHWTIVSSVVEVKHRMRKLKSQIPLHEQIQAIAYCLLYNVSSADLVQVLRVPVSSSSSLSLSASVSFKKKKMKKMETKKRQYESLSSSSSLLWSANAEPNKNTKSEQQDQVQNKSFSTTLPSLCKQNQPSSTLDKWLGLAKETNKLDFCYDDDDDGNNNKELTGGNNDRIECAKDKEREEQSSTCTEDPIDMDMVDTAQNKSEPAVATTAAAAATTNKTTQHQDILQANQSDDSDDDNDYDIQCLVHKVSLADPIVDHSKHWTQTVLPRLSSMVDAIYQIRGDDGKRLQLLLAVSEGTTGTNNFDAAWQLVFTECPWLLQDSLTAFSGRCSNKNDNSAA